LPQFIGGGGVATIGKALHGAPGGFVLTQSQAADEEVGRHLQHGHDAVVAGQGEVDVVYLVLAVGGEGDGH